MIKIFPCGLCSDEVGDNDSVQCDLCNRWNHTRCLNIGTEQSEILKKRSTALVLSKLCNENIFLNFI